MEYNYVEIYSLLSLLIPFILFYNIYEGRIQMVRKLKSNLIWKRKDTRVVTHS
jgi:hypothetical protein